MRAGLDGMTVRCFERGRWHLQGWSRTESDTLRRLFHVVLARDIEHLSTMCKALSLHNTSSNPIAALRSSHASDKSTVQSHRPCGA
jgi:hypothetical protein